LDSLIFNYKTLDENCVAMKFLLVAVLILSIYLSNHAEVTIPLMDNIGHVAIECFEWIYKTLNQNRAVLITIPIDADQDIIDTLAEQYGRKS